MTVRVLRVGPASHSSTITTSCRACESFLEFTKPDDVLIGEFKVSGSFFLNTAKVKERDYVICPHCNATVFV